MKNNSEELSAGLLEADQQSRDKASYGATFWNLDAIVLDDGTRIEFSVVELPHAASYGLEGFVVKPASSSAGPEPIGGL